MMMGTVAEAPSAPPVADELRGVRRGSCAGGASDPTAAPAARSGGRRARVGSNPDARAEKLRAVESLFTALAPSCEKWASRARVPIEDIRQDLYVLCLEVVLGESEYRTFAAASVYVAGRMWFVAERYREFRADPDKPLPERPAERSVQSDQYRGNDERMAALDERKHCDAQESAVLKWAAHAHNRHDGIEGNVRRGCEPPATFPGPAFKADRSRLGQYTVYTRAGDGERVFVDHGARIDVFSRKVAVIEAVVQLASWKYDALALLTGSLGFQARAAAVARRLGVRTASLARIRDREDLETLEIMRQLTWSQSRAARETGLSKATIRSRERRERKRRAESAS